MFLHPISSALPGQEEFGIAMCGIFAIHGLESPVSHRSKALACSKKQRHRGPDWSGCYVGRETILVHERLAIFGVGEPSTSVCSLRNFFFQCSLLDSGAQPLVYEDQGLALAVNGEIYNYAALKESFGPNAKFKTHSDCEVILHLVSFRRVVLTVLCSHAC